MHLGGVDRRQVRRELFEDVPHRGLGLEHALQQVQFDLRPAGAARAQRVHGVEASADLGRRAGGPVHQRGAETQFADERLEAVLVVLDGVAEAAQRGLLRGAGPGLLGGAERLHTGAGAEQVLIEEVLQHLLVHGRRGGLGAGVIMAGHGLCLRSLWSDGKGPGALRR